MESRQDFPILLNGLTRDGQVIHVSADGSAYVELPDNSPTAGRFAPTGHSPVITKRVRRPSHMRHPSFTSNPGAQLLCNREGTRCFAFPTQGNPPMPPKEVECPPCAKEFAERFATSGVAWREPSVLGRIASWFKLG
jgi:hypothetical protein